MGPRYNCGTLETYSTYEGKYCPHNNIKTYGAGVARTTTTQRKRESEFWKASWQDKGEVSLTMRIDACQSVRCRGESRDGIPRAFVGTLPPPLGVPQGSVPRSRRRSLRSAAWPSATRTASSRTSLMATATARATTRSSRPPRTRCACRAPSASSRNPDLHPERRKG